MDYLRATQTCEGLGTADAGDSAPPVERAEGTLARPPSIITVTSSTGEQGLRKRRPRQAHQSKHASSKSGVRSHLGRTTPVLEANLPSVSSAIPACGAHRSVTPGISQRARQFLCKSRLPTPASCKREAI